MMQKFDTDSALFSSLLEVQYKERIGKKPIDKIRTKGWERFNALKLPTKKTESYRYIKLRNLFSNPCHTAKTKSLDKSRIENHILPECQKSHIVFVNGSYTPELSCWDSCPSNFSLVSLEEAIQTYRSFFTNHISQSLENEDDSFVALNAALHDEGAFLYIPPASICTHPIQIINILTGGHASPRFHVYIGKQSKALFISTTISLADSSYTCNQVTDFVIEEEADVRLIQSPLTSYLDGWHLDAVRATLKKKSRFVSVNVNEGGLTNRYDYKVTLKGEEGEAALHGLSMLKEKQEAHTNVLITHDAENCRSHQNFKNVLTDQAHASFEGKIFVDQIAQQTEAYQLNTNLLLSDNARAESKPNLEIFADDVKASHGATFGQLSEEQIFYLMTRGLSRASAQNALIRGFCQEVIDEVPALSLQTILQKIADQLIR